MMMSSTYPMPGLIYGTAWKKERTSELLLAAFRAGFRGFDTACQPKHYNEPMVGLALKSLQHKGVNRADYYLQTKFTPLSGQDPKRLPYDASASLEEQVSQSFATSQKNLQTQYVDALILHSPLETFAETLTAWRAMENIYNKGQAWQIGISNCYDLAYLQQLYEAAEIKPSILQNRFYHQTDFDTDIRQWCIEKGIVYQSFWTLTANQQILESETLVRVAIRHNATAAQILFRYLNGIGIVPLTGTTDGEHMLEDLACLDIKLSPLETQAIATLFEQTNISQTERRVP